MEKTVSKKPEKRPVLVSGITPSGQLTLGNYIGAIKNFVKLQEEYDMYIFVADLHAITNEFDPAQLAQNVRNVFALYLACGLDPQRATIFVQSHVMEHAQLGHILLCHTTMGELSRMTQFKDKSKGAGKEQVLRTGLLTYPALMAADILLYDPEIVPVGADQKQHVELTRDIAQRVNNKYGKVFAIPEPRIQKQGARIMSLTDPTKKMSKSDKDKNAYIALLDSPKVAAKKIMSAVTDSENKIAYDPVKKPGIANLLTIYAELSGTTAHQAEKECQAMGYGEFKKKLAEKVTVFLTELQARHAKLSDKKELENIMFANAQKARTVASKKLALVQKAIGIGG